MFDKMSEEMYQNWYMWYLDISSRAAIYKLISYRIRRKQRIEKQLSSRKIELEILKKSFKCRDAEDVWILCWM